MKHFFIKPLTLGIFAIVLASCTTMPTPQAPSKTTTTTVIVPKPPVAKPRPTPPVQQPVKAVYHSFSDWKADFVNRATARGVNRYELERLLNTAEYNERVVASDRSQAEFAKMPWDYAESAVSSSRVSQGKRSYANQSDILLRAESQYGVPASIVTAIWGMESSYGQGTGNASLTSSLATLAYDGRRQAFAENQLLALLTMLQRGDLDWSQLKGSWAGGMGHTQFIPQTWI